MKIVAFIPIKLNNERAPGKNIKKFHDGTPLMHFIQKTLLQVEGIDEIYCYCSAPSVTEYLIDGVTFLQRSTELDTSSTTSNDLLRTFSDLVSADIYIYTLATAPFITSDSLKRGLCAVQSGKYDSAFSTEELQEFIWQEGMPLNFSPDNIPRTQDLPKLHIESCGFYIFTKDVVKKNGLRIGKLPYLVEVSSIEAVDIDYPEDFEIAEAIYRSIILGGDYEHYHS